MKPNFCTRRKMRAPTSRSAPSRFAFTSPRSRTLSRKLRSFPALRHGLQDMTAHHHVVPAPSLDEGRGRVGRVLIMSRSEKMVLNPKWIGLSSSKTVRCRVAHSMSPFFPTRTRRSTCPGSRAPHTADRRAREPLPPARRCPSSPPFEQPVVSGNPHQSAGFAIFVPGSVSGNWAALSAFAPM